jgi:hypothetical protein
MATEEWQKRSKRSQEQVNPSGAPATRLPHLSEEAQGLERVKHWGPSLLQH